jgi:class 3 adenylate cyclase
MSRHKEDVLSEICEKHKKIHHTCVEGYKGSLIHIYGDASLSVFTDPVEAVKCAVEIQQLSCQEPVIPLRIAIHYGEVKREGDEVFGNTVNITSRILNAAIASSILISDQVQPFMDKKHGIPSRSLGKYTFKYVDHPVEVFGIRHGNLVLPEALSNGLEKPEETPDGFTKGKRLLAAIMFTDMVGYTALMQEDEQKAKRYRDRHRNILQTFINQHQGIILQYYGDGTLSIFHSSIEAVNCAIDIQSKLQEEPKIPLRIGIHVADIMYDDEGIYGDGVNVASRIEMI